MKKQHKNKMSFKHQKMVQNERWFRKSQVSSLSRS